MLYLIQTPKPLAETAAALEQAVKARGFGVVAAHDLQQTMRSKGVEFDRPCLVLEVCNPHQAKAVLTADMTISTTLPCRISLWTEGGRTRLATIRPTAMLELFQAAGLMEVARAVEEVLVGAMDEAASG